MKFLVILILGIVANPCFSQKNRDTIKSKTIKLNEIVISNNRDVNKIISNIKRNINKNYDSTNNHNFEISQVSVKDADTIVLFDGSLEYKISNYKKSDLFYNNTYGFLCISKTRKINKDSFIDWFPSQVGKSYKSRVEGGPCNKTPFFITGSMNLIAIQNYDFVDNYKKYEFSFEDVGDNFLKLSFFPKENNSNNPFEGYIIINKKDYAIVEVRYKNSLQYKLEISSWYNLVDNIEISLKFKKDDTFEKYILESFDAFCSFKDLLKDNVQFSKYTSTTHIKINEDKLPTSYKKEKINLTDLGLIFKSDTNDYLYDKKLF
jgi:hypothetical protein